MTDTPGAARPSSACRCALLDDSLFDGACLSDDGRFRYALWRRWGKGPTLFVVMLNPSTADATQDDPTIRRVIGFARDWGYGGVIVGNAFALRAADPHELLADPHGAVGPDNDRHLRDFVEIAEDGGAIIVGWGANIMRPQLRFRVDEIADILPGADCWGMSKDGAPLHPLYQRADTKPVMYEWPVFDATLSRERTADEPQASSESPVSSSVSPGEAPTGGEA